MDDPDAPNPDGPTKPLPEQPALAFSEAPTEPLGPTVPAQDLDAVLTEAYGTAAADSATSRSEGRVGRAWLPWVLAALAAGLIVALAIILIPRIQDPGTVAPGPTVSSTAPAAPAGQVGRSPVPRTGQSGTVDVAPADPAPPAAPTTAPTPTPTPPPQPTPTPTPTTPAP